MKISLVITSTLCARLFLGGGSISSDNIEVYDALRAATGKNFEPNRKIFTNCGDWETTKCPKVAVFTSNGPNYAYGKDVFENDGPKGELSYINLFQKHGFASRHVTVHIDNYQVHAYDTPQGRSNMKTLQDADVVYFNGGDQARTFTSLYQADMTPSPLFRVLQELVNNNKLIVYGTSAGSMTNSLLNYGEGTSYGYLYFGGDLKESRPGEPNGLRDDRRISETELRLRENGGFIKSFGFTDFFVDTHCNARGRQIRMMVALQSLKASYGACVDEDTVFFLDNDVATVYGSNGVTIVDVRDARKDSTGKSKYRASRIRMSYLTSGDKLSKSLQVTSTKNEIVKPFDSVSYDSADIFLADEIVQTLKHTVDTTAPVSVGQTKLLSAFPSKAPVWSIRFYKDKLTKGFVKDSKYTSVNILVDVY